MVTKNRLGGVTFILENSARYREHLDVASMYLYGVLFLSATFV